MANAKARSFDAEKALVHMLAAARAASAAIMKVYSTDDFRVELKAKDDPVTRADKEANAILIEMLTKHFPDVPIVAEESPPSEYAGFEKAERAFFVDPLDGTREFVARNGEFCVMVGLAEKGRARLGVVVCPTDGRAFIGGTDGLGAWEVHAKGVRTPIHVAKKKKLEAATCIISRSHRSPETDAILSKLHAKKLVPYGSAGLKALQVARGDVDLYCHPGPSGCRWDSCAVEALVLGAGGAMTTAAGKPFDYRKKQLKNKTGVLAGNPILHAAALASLLST